ncbi:NOL1/NOP2/sun family putative RNA methylase [Candidatus Woesearchaeota archaeon]|nr:NOL1/NOP2/sun family putative RNA methylase [Candidatus Woesearchaeota archaeon]
MPNWNDIPFKKTFLDRYAQWTDIETFKVYSTSFLRRSIRINTLKITVKECKERLEKNWILTPIPWCKEGFFVEHKEGRRDIGNTLEHSMGYYYVQEAASLIPPVVLDPQKHTLVLDMCAAPGSKATQLSQYMENTGVLIANDYTGIRLAPLGINMQRMGCRNQLITLMHGQWFKDLSCDAVLVDAPCSGTGTIRKSLKTLRIWNPDMIKKLGFVQKKLIQKGFDLLKNGQSMVYSTCSHEPQENEEVVDFLLKNNETAKIEKIDLPLERSDPLFHFEKKQYDESIKHTLRLWPQDNDTEGFFVAKIKKEK